VPLSIDLSISCCRVIFLVGFFFFVGVLVVVGVAVVVVAAGGVAVGSAAGAVVGCVAGAGVVAAGVSVLGAFWASKTPAGGNIKKVVAIAIRESLFISKLLPSKQGERIMQFGKDTLFWRFALIAHRQKSQKS
jgi:hypothetical protein